MATTAHVMSSLDVPAADDLDMHSDSGLDFGDGDGDIDLDLEPAPMSHREDDDVSIIDAASDAGHNGQPGFEEQDDFMIDPEDAIEEDDMYADVQDPTIVEQPPADSTASVPAPLDEDLIDYSDDEGEQPTYAPVESHEEDMAEVPEEQAEEHAHEQVEPQLPEIATVEHVEQPQHPTQSEPTEYDTNADGTDARHRTPDQSRDESTVHGDGNSTDGEQGGVLLQEHHSPTAEDTESEHDQAGEQTRDDQTTEQFVNDNEHGKHEYDNDHDQNEYDEHHEDKSSEERSITVNYAGNELWLFKQHDPDDSGDWLLNDISLIKSRISDVFQACRASLGDDVSNEHEIGFRFDHLHSLELYEDNTACVAVSLDKLVDLYHTLQAQDGNNEPESFYISLLFRPRFATLLSDIAKFADEGSGYSALNAAVAAGETHFTNVFSESPSEEATEWDNEKQDDAATDGHDDSAQSEVQQEDDQTEHTIQQHDATDDEHDDHQQYDHDNSKLEETFVDSQTGMEQGRIGAHVSAADDDGDGSLDSTEQQELAYPQDDEVIEAVTETLSEADARRAQEEDDLVGYSDDEDENPTLKDKTASVKGSSPSSSTVQGDETVDAQDNAHTAGSSSEDVQKIEAQESENVDHGNEHDVSESNEAATQSFHDYAVENFDTSNEVDKFEAEAEGSFGLDDQYGNSTNEDMAQYDNQTTDQQLQLDFTNDSEVYNDGGDFIQNDYTESDAFLDFNNTSTWVSDQEPDITLPENSVLVHDDVDYVEDEEAGVAEPAVAAVTSDATVAAVSSSEPKNSSPQGHKRSIDEAGHGNDDALDSIDTKRPKV